MVAAGAEVLSDAVWGAWADLWQRLSPSQGLSTASCGLYDNRGHTGFSPSASGTWEENLSFFLLVWEPW